MENVDVFLRISTNTRYTIKSHEYETSMYKAFYTLGDDYMVSCIWQKYKIVNL